jgi:hypothetical protein
MEVSTIFKMHMDIPDWDSLYKWKGQLNKVIIKLQPRLQSPAMCFKKNIKKATRFSCNSSYPRHSHKKYHNLKIYEN